MISYCAPPRSAPPKIALRPDISGAKQLEPASRPVTPSLHAATPDEMAKSLVRVGLSAPRAVWQGAQA